MLQEVAHDNNFNLTETVYSQFATHHSLKKAAFTLAEVLITLGIIGVVAAITLPTLIKNYQKKVLETQFKKSVAFVQNSYRKAIADEGVDSIFDTQIAYKYSLEGSSNFSYGFSSEKFASKFGYELLPINQLKNSPLKALKSADVDYYIYSNGACFTFDSVEQRGWHSITGVDVALFSTYIDVNCDKGPNKGGRDVFVLMLNSNAKIDYYGYGSSDDWQQICNEDVFNEALNSGEISKDELSLEIGRYCAARVISDGWKMNY